MLPLGNTPRFLKRLGVAVDRDEQRRTERVLASARVFLACAGMIAIYLDPTEPSRYATLAYILLIAYLAYSVGVWLALQRNPEFSSSFPWMHGCDMLFPAVFTLFTEGPNSPFFVFFVFVLTAAAFRWGFVETMLTSGIICLLMSGEAVLLTYGRHLGTWLEGEYELNRFVIRLSYLLILGILLGYLAENEKLLRAENAFISRIMGKARADVGLRGTLQTVIGAAMRLFLAPRALVVVQQAGSGRVFLWHAHAVPGEVTSISWAEASPEQHQRYLWSFPAHSCYSQRRGQHWAAWGIDTDGKRARFAEAWSPASCPEMNDAASVLAVTINLGEEWSGSVLLFDAVTATDKLQELRFVQKLFRQAGPAIYAVYLLRRLRSRAGAVERARVARELHDGTIQALIAIEMEVDVLRREAGHVKTAAKVAPGLERIQEMLREQVFDLRTLMQQMRPVEFAPGQFLDRLADTVERFRRDSGIAAEFVSALDDLDLSPRVCRELIRITQEALANVRKHSGAHHVLVSFGMSNGTWILTVQDDGRGLGFNARMSLPELEARRKGPEVIKERVRILGGDLEIESLTGQGTRLQVTLPQKAQAGYA